jgi:hypothetical protein
MRLHYGRVVEDIVSWFDQPALRRALDVGASLEEFAPET